MARKTSILKAPYHPNGSLLHYPGDYHEFDHYEADDGTVLQKSDIWTEEKISPSEGGPWGSISRTLRHDWKIIYREAEWRDNLPFHATLQIAHMNHGRSAKYLTWKPLDEPLDPRTFPMFVTDLIAVARTGLIQKDGIVSGRWMVTGRGQNFGIRLTKEGE